MGFQWTDSSCDIGEKVGSSIRDFLGLPVRGKWVGNSWWCCVIVMMKAQAMA